MASNSDIGRQINERRSELDLTIRELSRRTGLSASFISQLEHGKTNVSLDSLRLIAEQLDVSMQFFFLEPDPLQALNEPIDEQIPPADPAREYSPVVRANARAQLVFPDSGVNYQMLMKDLNRNMEAIYGRISPGKGNVARRLRKQTEEFIFVVSGKLQLVLKEKKFILSPGDSIYFDGFDLNEISCASEDQDAVWISVITPPVF
jgi:transcriptional regulator with XRE-family HTH domain